MPQGKKERKKKKKRKRRKKGEKRKKKKEEVFLHPASDQNMCRSISLTFVCGYYDYIMRVSS